MGQNNDDQDPNKPDQKNQLVILFFEDPADLIFYSDSQKFSISMGGGSPLRDLLTNNYFSNPTFVGDINNPLEDSQFNKKYLIDRIKDYIIQNGPIDELVVEGHGAANFIDSSTTLNSKGQLEITEFLEALDELKSDPDIQKKLNPDNDPNIQIKLVTERIFFPGCDTFSDGLFSEEIKFFQKYATDNDVSIIGSSTTTSASNNHENIFSNFICGLSGSLSLQGRIVEFNKDGSITRPSEDDDTWFTRLINPDSNADQTKTDCLIQNVTSDAVQQISAEQALELGLQCIQDVDSENKSPSGLSGVGQFFKNLFNLP